VTSANATRIEQPLARIPTRQPHRSAVDREGYAGHRRLNGGRHQRPRTHSHHAALGGSHGTPIAYAGLDEYDRRAASPRVSTTTTWRARCLLAKPTPTKGFRRC
jgi:hypothetical protein